MYNTYEENVAAYTSSSQQQVKHDGSHDHESLVPTFLPSFKHVLKRSMDHVEVLRNTPFCQQKSRVWMALAAALDRSRTPFVSEPFRIAVVGDTGEGQSYLIGTLLGDAGIAIDVSSPSLVFSITLAKILFQEKSGQSCTRVVVEYHHMATTPIAK